MLFDLQIICVTTLFFLIELSFVSFNFFVLLIIFSENRATRWEASIGWQRIGRSTDNNNEINANRWISILGEMRTEFKWTSRQTRIHGVSVSVDRNVSVSRELYVSREYSGIGLKWISDREIIGNVWLALSRTKTRYCLFRYTSILNLIKKAME